MSTTSASSIYVNLPVKDLQKSIAFFTSLGFSFNQQFTDDTATCMIVGPNICVMLLTHAKFSSFIKQPISDAHKSTEVLICIAVESRDKVNELVGKAIAGGGKVFRDSNDHGFMYEHAFQDIDGHIWELIYMDQAGLAKLQGQHP
jgi:predicted lactoylglutathione lyase